MVSLKKIGFLNLVILFIAWRIIAAHFRCGRLKYTEQGFNIGIFEMRIKSRDLSIIHFQLSINFRGYESFITTEIIDT